MRIKACIFDLYGTLLDLQSVLTLASTPLGKLAPAVLALWRQKQLEYSWIETLRGRYRNFSQLTEEALHYALQFHGIQDPRVHAILRDSYEHLRPYDDALPNLERLKAKGLVLCLLSNGEPDMIDKGLQKAGMARTFHFVLSVDAVRKYKPSREVYRLAEKKLSLQKQEIAFVSANSWDAAGAQDHGLRVFRLQRGFSLPEEYGFDEKTPRIKSLDELEGLLGRMLGD